MVSLSLCLKFYSITVALLVSIVAGKEGNALDSDSGSQQKVIGLVFAAAFSLLHG